LVKSAGEANYDFQILDAVMQVNETQKSILVPKIKAHFNGNLKGKHFAMWGLSFKPDTDDIREAPALYIIDALLAEGATVTAFDPEGMDNVKKLGKKIKFAPNPYEALEKSDALVICTEWSLFRNPDFSEMASKIASKTIFDGRNLYSVDQMKKLGFAYYSIGRKAIRKSKP
jgi:UDPglucose 6-dehydrogenase